MSATQLAVLPSRISTRLGMFDNREMMAISGHKSERVFEKYIKVGVSEQADRIYNKLKVLKGGKNKKVG